MLYLILTALMVPQGTLDHPYVLHGTNMPPTITNGSQGAFKTLRGIFKYDSKTNGNVLELQLCKTCTVYARVTGDHIDTVYSVKAP